MMGQQRIGDKREKKMRKCEKRLELLETTKLITDCTLLPSLPGKVQHIVWLASLLAGWLLAG